MHEEAPDELLDAQGHHPSGVACFFAPGRKGDRCPGDFHNAAVGDGDLMCVAPKVLDGIAKTVEGLLDERAPVLLVRRVPEAAPFIMAVQFLAGGREHKLPCLMEPVKLRQVFSFELIPQHVDRDEKLIF